MNKTTFIEKSEDSNGSVENKKNDFQLQSSVLSSEHLNNNKNQVKKSLKFIQSKDELKIEDDNKLTFI